MTNQSGTAVQYMSFDACLPARSEAKAGGRRRNHTDWTYTNVPTSFLVSRGYTMHACPPAAKRRREHLDQFGLINMPARPKRSEGGNGRVYDPVLGRFLEPDNYVQAPGLTQSYNRYSYCFNNPLKFTDPSGYFSWRNFWSFTVSAVVGVGVTILTGGNVLAGAWAGAFAGEMVRSGGDVSKSLNAGGMSIFGAVLGVGAGQALRAIGGLKAPGWGLLNSGNGRFVPPMNNTISSLANRITRNIGPLIDGISNGTLFNAAGGSNFSWVVSGLFDGSARSGARRVLNYNSKHLNIDLGKGKCKEYAYLSTHGEQQPYLKEDSYKILTPGEYDFNILEEDYNDGWDRAHMSLQVQDENGVFRDHRIAIKKIIYKPGKYFRIIGPDPNYTDNTDGIIKVHRVSYDLYKKVNDEGDVFKFVQLRLYR